MLCELGASSDGPIQAGAAGLQLQTPTREVGLHFKVGALGDLLALTHRSSGPAIWAV